MKIRDVETALDVLLELSETSDDGDLRDDIGRVRHALWERLEEPAHSSPALARALAARERGVTASG